MLDYINWYLVELERRLKNTREAEASADMVRETRSHLEEKVAELVDKGMDPVSASKAALADFGDPETVVRAYLRPGGMKERWYRAWVFLGSAFAGICALTLAYFVVQQTIFMDRSTTWVLYSPFVLAVLILGVAWKTRRWYALPVALTAVGAAAIGSVWSASSIEIFELRGNRLHTYRGAIGPQIQAREAWLKAVDADAPTINALLAAAKSKDDKAFMKVFDVRGQIVAPLPETRWRPRTVLLYRGTSQPGPLLEPYATQGGRYSVQLVSVTSPAEAIRSWKEHGQEFATYLAKEKALVQSEIEALRRPLETSFWERWTRLGFPVLALVGFVCLPLLLLNGIVVGLIDLRRHLRLGAWRRQVG